MIRFQSFFRAIGFLFPMLWWTIRPLDSFPLSHHTMKSAAVTTTRKRLSQKDAMKELRAHVSFTKLRLHCRKQRGRTIHVNTAANSSGETAVQYFNGQTDVLPLACGSFDRMGNDNSKIAGMCDQWKRKKRGSPTAAQERLNECPFLCRKYISLVVNTWEFKMGV